MNSTDKINKIKILLGMIPDVKFEVVKLNDGSEAEIDKLEVGGVLHINGESAADGEYVLEDGRTIVVAEGVISEVRDAEAKDNASEEVEAAEEVSPAEDTEEPEEAPEAEAEGPSVEDRVAAIESTIDDLYKLISELQTKVVEAETNANEAVEGFKKVSSEPSAEPVHVGLAKEIEMSTLESRLAKIKSLKNR